MRYFLIRLITVLCIIDCNNRNAAFHVSLHAALTNMQLSCCPNVVIFIKIVSVKKIYHKKLLKEFPGKQGCSARGVCFGSRRHRGSYFSWLGLASASHGLASVLMTSISTLLPRPQLCLVVSASVLARSRR